MKTVSQIMAVSVRKTAGVVAAAALSLSLAYAQDDPTAQADLTTGYPDVDVMLSELGDSFLRVGQYVEAASLVQVSPGTSGEVATRLLGTPEAVERMDDFQYWYYNINLPLADGVNQLVCQYRVGMNGALEITGTEWRRPQCRSAFEAFTESLQLMEFSSDVLFEFDSEQLQPEGRRLLLEVARVLSNQYENPDIQVIGYTDRIGAEAYNQRLSERRANAVYSYLGSNGVPQGWMQVEGRGMREPVVTCLGTQVTDELKDCLAPNRRVHIAIEEQELEASRSL